jgi:uncharacterized membrane protein
MGSQSGGSATLDERVEELERRLHEVSMRLATIEAPAGSRSVHDASTPPPPAPAAVPAPSPAARAPAARTPGAPQRLADRARALDLEDLFGGRVLAWTGGLAVVIAVALFFGVAVSNGWIGEGARILLGGLGSLALAGLGAWLAERRRRTDAALAAVAAGVAGLFLTVAVGAQVYEVVAPAVALPLALVVGASTTAVALRWTSQGIAALGLLGGLAAPALAGAPSDGVTLWLLWIVAACAAAVLVQQRWPRLLLPAFALTSVQWGEWLDGGQPVGEALLVLVGFGAVTIASGAGDAVRTASARLPRAAVALLAVNALVLSAAGLSAFDGALADGWVAALAGVHLAAGVAGGGRVTGRLRLTALALGTILADVALGLILDGSALAVAYAATLAIVGAVAWRVARGRGDGELLLGWTLGGQALLAAGQALSVAPPDLALDGGEGAAAVIAPLAVALGGLAAARLVLARREAWSAALDALGLAAVAYTTAVLLDGAWLPAAWSVLAATLLPLARAKREEGGVGARVHRRNVLWPRAADRVAACGALGFLALGLCHVLAFEAPPVALIDGLDDALAAALALGALAAAATVLALARMVDPSTVLRSGVAPEAQDSTGRFAVHGAPSLRAPLAGLAGLAALFLASTLLVTPFQPGPGDPGTALLDLPLRQQGQVLLSALWAMVGVGILAGGLVRDVRVLRLAGLVLLGVTAAKVVAYDLATLTALYRVASLLALGLLLLVGAFLWQRVRPLQPH